MRSNQDYGRSGQRANFKPQANSTTALGEEELSYEESYEELVAKYDEARV